MCIQKWSADLISYISSNQKLMLCTTVSATTLAFAVYYIVKRSSTSKSVNSHKFDARKQRMNKHGKEYLQVRVPKDVVGGIIGKEGSMIKELQTQTGTRIKLEQDENLSEVSGDECIVHIYGPDMVSVQYARQMITTIVSSKSDIFTISVPLPQEMVGRVIGKGGLRIRDLQRASGARIIIEKSSCAESQEKQTTTTIIKGTVEQIDMAKSLIQEILDEAAEFEHRLQRAITSRQRRGHGATTGHVNDNTSGREDNEMSEKVEVKTESTVNGMSGLKLHGDKNDDESPSDLTDCVLPLEALKSEDADGFIVIVISQVISPGHFYVQKANDRLDKLNEKLEAVYSGTEGYTINVRDLSVGTLVAAKFTDGKWYRGMVKSNPGSEGSDTTVQVFFFDFGDYLQVLYSDCRTLLAQFYYLPQQAVECYLHGICDIIKADANSELFEETIDLFDDLTNGETGWKRLMLKCVHMKASDGKPCVKLVDTNEEDDVNIAEELVKKQLLKPNANCQ